MEHRFAQLSGVRIHYVEAGRGPLVLLLHGFPEFWYSWRRQIPALAGAGFRVLAPDLRGYNLSDKPKGLENYRIDKIVGDVVGLIRHAGESRAAIVGHDWGGAIAWETAIRHPEVVQRLAILNCPHPAVFSRELHTWEQRARSWYMLYFQIPWLSELSILGSLKAIFRGDVARHGAFSASDLAEYYKAATRPGALTAALNYYRAAFRFERHRVLRTRPKIHAPTMLLWGEQDRYLGIRNTEGLEAWVSDLRIVRLPHASHWVQADAPEEVSRLLVGFCSGKGNFTEVTCIAT